MGITEDQSYLFILSLIRLTHEILVDFVICHAI